MSDDHIVHSANPFFVIVTSLEDWVDMTLKAVPNCSDDVGWFKVVEAPLTCLHCLGVENE